MCKDTRDTPLDLFTDMIDYHNPRGYSLRHLRPSATIIRFQWFGKPCMFGRAALNKAPLFLIPHLSLDDSNKLHILSDGYMNDALWLNVHDLTMLVEWLDNWFCEKQNHRMVNDTRLDTWRHAMDQNNTRVFCFTDFTDEEYKFLFSSHRTTQMTYRIQ